MDLAATDILRTRELGVPRYNEFRRLLHLPRRHDFEELTDNPKWAEEMRRVYDGDIEQVDLMVGMFAEPLPKGFAFSDTAFRIFILMASRRLNSDRFFTTDYTPGSTRPKAWSGSPTPTCRPCSCATAPSSEPALRGLTNAFAPWNPAAAMRHDFEQQDPVSAARRVLVRVDGAALPRPLLPRQFDRVLRPPIVAAVQALINRAPPREDLGIAEERILPGEGRRSARSSPSRARSCARRTPTPSAERVGNTKTYGVVRGTFEVLPGPARAAAPRRLRRARGRSDAWVRFGGPGPHRRPTSTTTA